MHKMKVSEALTLLKDNGFTLLHMKGTHMKYGKGELRIMITNGGWHHTGELHSKQQKELMNAIKGIDNIKEQIKHDKI